MSSSAQFTRKAGKRQVRAPNPEKPLLLIAPSNRGILSESSEVIDEQVCDVVIVQWLLAVLLAQ
jgi:hypothetical protein